MAYLQLQPVPMASAEIEKPSRGLEDAHGPRRASTDVKTIAFDAVSDLRLC